ncbi:LysR family transcriptional regulator [Microbulbifer celer]|uniref:LysR family transcriptional regulator n=1 Tax=Microbulbifer celer TaxID=435905 RepID=A0ABW3UAU1_9GAMM|nr:LysR family transcriptional regulator [Microbulbifer celer]UFN59177.1 LysR family transcriptional regulator [Microbulbifer celer]
MQDLRELKVFSQVIKTGSLTASAKNLATSKSTLSRRIRQLESSVGQMLLKREANKLVPTEAGQVFYRYCEEILRLAELGRGEIEELREEVSGTLVLCAHEILIRPWLAELVEEFVLKYPAVKAILHTQTQLPTETEDDALYFWVGRVTHCDQNLMPLGNLTQSVYGHPDYLQRMGMPDHPRALARYDWVNSINDDSGLLTLHREGEDSHPIPGKKSCMQVDQVSLQADTIARARGLGLLPDWHADLRESFIPGALQRCLPQWSGPLRPVSLIYGHGQLPRRLKVFIEFVRQHRPEQWQAARAMSESTST